MSLEMMDAIGVPEYFITTIGRVESAGDGCVRVYGCSEKGGMLVPQYTVVMPVLSMIAATKLVQETALQICSRTLLAGAFGVH